MNLYVVKDGIKDVAFIRDNEGRQILGTNYYSISYDFKSNEGYIEKKSNNFWRLYTQVGQKYGQSRHHKFSSFEDCILKLKELNGNRDIIICDSTEIQKYSEK
ncbi:hypothetical protein [Tamlana flava]|uniref:hypothetical protein n=1 Tax=Tamlana flava TaxID=3158572 RepID=UPI00351BDB2C